MLYRTFITLLLSSVITVPVLANDTDYLISLYKHLHANPELSFNEKNTAARIAKELTSVGFDVTKNVGGHGLVGQLNNGDGPTVMIRTDLDAIPVFEKTGLSYASNKTFKLLSGKELPVAHACGHDMHMSVFIGTARYMAENLDKWQGTLVMIGQPAEERGAGAKAMLADGLFKRFPRPDYNIALHVTANLPAGKIGHHAGYMTAAVDTVKIIIPGVGGHGAFPHKTKDPVVLTASIIMQLQTLVSREIEPMDAAILSIGSIHGGTKANIIPDKVELEGTLRYFSEKTGDHMRNGIRRIAKGTALAMNLPENLMPIVSFNAEPGPSIWNDPNLNAQLVDKFNKVLGKSNVIAVPAITSSEDFSYYGNEKPSIPSVMFQLGTIDPEKFAEAQAQGIELPGPHSPFFAPSPEGTIRTGVLAMSIAAMELLPRNQ